MRRPLLLLACAAALLVAGPTPALAQGKKPPGKLDPRIAEAKRLFDEGAAAYAQGSYEAAIHAWEKSYELSQKPLIFESIANAWERLGDARKARDNLARWRDSAPPEERDLLDARLKNLDARVQREDEAAQKAAADQAQRAAAARAAADAARTKPWLPGAVLLGAGGVLAIVGVALDGVARSKRPDPNACKTVGGQTFCMSSASSAIKTSNALAIAGDALWITGAAAAAAGVVLVIVRRAPPPADAAPPVAAPPPPAAYLAPAAGGLVLGGVF